MTKECKFCKRVLPLDMFYRAPERPTGHRTECSDCSRAKYKKYYALNKAKRSAKHGIWQRNNRPRLNAKRKEEYRKNPERSYRHHLKGRFGMTVDDYIIMSEKQQHKCAICFIDKDKLKKRMHVDHDHKTGKVRALLCSRCNVAIGMFFESTDNLLAAYRYILKHNSTVWPVVQ